MTWGRGPLPYLACTSPPFFVAQIGSLVGIVTGLQTRVGHGYGLLIHTPRKTHTRSTGLSGFDGFVSAPSKKKKTPKTEFLGEDLTDN